ncbi:Zinc finger protein [Plakobranchus ocellatus]|uniref:Zinc finger protein n=1 Tax=Plakobranchus ocellatus TaxID=259542 RepID=A0AAV3Z9H6_9GAST|nr:Zinc finger protein [Plakobranchus ocellatus]
MESLSSVCNQDMVLNPSALTLSPSAALPQSPGYIGESHLPNSSVPFTIHSDSFPLPATGGYDKDSAGFPSPRASLLENLMYRQETTTESCERVSWPTVVDSRIPFTTYLQNLTRTLRLASASKKLNFDSEKIKERSGDSPPSTSSLYGTKNDACADHINPADVTSFPRSLSCGIQAEPDSSCCDDERGFEAREIDDEVSNYDKQVDSDKNAETPLITEKSTHRDEDKCFRKLKIRTLKRPLSEEKMHPSTQVDLADPFQSKTSRKQEMFGKILPDLFIPPAHQTLLGDVSQTAFSAPVLPFSSVPAPRYSSSHNASDPYQFHLHHHSTHLNSHNSMHHHTALQQQQQQQQQQYHHQNPERAHSSNGSRCRDANLLSVSLPNSLLHYHLQKHRQEKQQQHHHFLRQLQQQQQQQHQELREQKYPSDNHDGRLLLDPTLFQGGSSIEADGQDRAGIFSKMLMDSHPQPNGFIPSDSIPVMQHLHGARNLSGLAADVSGLLHPSLLGLGSLSSLSMRRASVDKPAPVKKYKCDVCQKAFSRSNTLVTHKRIHTGDKPFKCEVCGRAFRQPGNLTRHRLTHTTHKPYVCQVCSKAFNRASNLNTHIRTHTSFRQFSCSACPKTFHQKAELASHVFSHTAEPRIFPH